ncbi:MAG: TolC family protein, partial [Hyphomicrobiales bacterium]|nr:TolC family protein [Hyphomicrobiales bacterium]
ETEQVAPDATVSAAVAASDAVVKESTEKAEKTASLTAEPEPKRQRASYNNGAAMSLSDAVARAVTLHPRVGINRARADQALYGVDIAKAAGMPKVEAKLGAGENTVSTYDHMNDNLFKDGTGLSSIRIDAGISVRQTLYDFGVIKNDVARSEAVHDAETLKLLDRAEEIALETVNAYLRILEQRELVALADEHVAAHERLAKIVKQNEEDGNSTVADVERIAARLVDVKTERTNLDNDLQSALDRFKRLARTEPGRLSRPSVSQNAMPPTSQAAVERAVQNNPRLLSLEKAIDALNRELDSQMAKFKPKVEVELEGTTKNYLDTQARTEFDVRGMLVLSHKLYDGGERRSYAEQIQARIDENEMRYTDTRDEVEADLRQNYRSIDSSRRKLKSLREGAASSTKVRELYLEQFKAGERTIFELLDSQSAYYMAKRELINNQFDEMRSIYEILRSMGMLTETITGKPALEL